MIIWFTFLLAPAPEIPAPIIEPGTYYLQWYSLPYKAVFFKDGCFYEFQENCTSNVYWFGKWKFDKKTRILTIEEFSVDDGVVGEPYKWTATLDSNLKSTGHPSIKLTRSLK